jgi:hypothetical protein
MLLLQAGQQVGRQHLDHTTRGLDAGTALEAVLHCHRLGRTNRHDW